MISLKQVLGFRKYMYEKSSLLVEAKGHDYNGAQQNSGDTLFNLRVAALSGIVDLPERGILVRLMDKLQRLNSLLLTDPQVKDESVLDTAADIHNYVDYLVMLKMERDGTNIPQKPMARVVIDPEEHEAREREIKMLRTQMARALGVLKQSDDMPPELDVRAAYANLRADISEAKAILEACSDDSPVRVPVETGKLSVDAEAALRGVAPAVIMEERGLLTKKAPEITDPAV